MNPVIKQSELMQRLRDRLETPGVQLLSNLLGPVEATTTIVLDLQQTSLFNMDFAAVVSAMSFDLYAAVPIVPVEAGSDVDTARTSAFDLLIEALGALECQASESLTHFEDYLDGTPCSIVHTAIVTEE